MQFEGVFVLFHFNILVVYIFTLTLGLFVNNVSQEVEMMVLTQSDFFSIFDQRRGGLKFFIFRQMPYVNGHLLPLSSIKLFFTFTLVLYLE